MSAPVIVLGAGIAGVSAALHLQQRGRDVLLLEADRPGGGTSHGNAGLIEQSTAFPHPCPQDLRTLLRYALNRAPDLRWQARDIPGQAMGLYAYWRNSRHDRIERIGAAFRSLIAAALPEHRALAGSAGLDGMLRPSGWLELVRDPRLLAVDRAAAVTRFGIAVTRLDSAELERAEPHLRQRFAGAFHWQGTASLADPGGYTAGLARHFRAKGGQIVTGRALALAQQGAGWRVASSAGTLDAAAVVVALGPWSPDLLRPLGLRVPMLFKRGYHRHFAPLPGTTLNHPVHVPGSGHLVVPAATGIRVLTGVELAHRDAPADLRQMQVAEASARRYLPLGEACEDQPWLGTRPCLPDMLPLIGQSSRLPGLWLLFGHGHHGLTQGPASARLLAELMESEAPFLDAAPFSPARLGL